MMQSEKYWIICVIGSCIFRYLSSNYERRSDHSFYLSIKVAEEEWDTAKPNKRKPLRQEMITHISIHTIHLDGLRQLHRHFLKLNNGAIVEVRSFIEVLFHAICHVKAVIAFTL